MPTQNGKPKKQRGGQQKKRKPKRGCPTPNIFYHPCRELVRRCVRSIHKYVLNLSILTHYFLHHFTSLAFLTYHFLPLGCYPPVYLLSMPLPELAILSSANIVFSSLYGPCIRYRLPPIPVG
jgi:hypothetical protein